MLSAAKALDAVSGASLVDIESSMYALKCKMVEEVEKEMANGKTETMRAWEEGQGQEDSSCALRKTREHYYAVRAF